MTPRKSRKVDQQLSDVDQVLLADSKEKENASPRRGFRETSSRLNRPMPMSSLLHTLPEESDGDLLQKENIDKPAEYDGIASNNVVFGFSTPSKKRGRPSLLQLAVIGSAQKRQVELEKSPPNAPEPASSDEEEEDNDNAGSRKVLKTPTRQSSKTTPQTTPKDRRTPSNKAVSERVSRTPTTPTTPRVTRGRTLLTPQCVRKADKGSDAGTPRSRRSLAPQLQTLEDDDPATPKAFRTRVKTRIMEVAYDTDMDQDSSEEEKGFASDDSCNDQDYKAPSSSDTETDTTQSSVASSAVSSDDDEYIPVVKNNVKGSKKRTSPISRKKPGRKRLQADVDQGSTTTEDYFLHNDGSGAAAVTSDHTLNKLSVPRLTADVLQSIMSKTRLDHCDEREDLYNEHCAYFHKWRTLLGYGYSVFLHGVGSKKRLISEFQEEMLDNDDHLVVNGFFPSLTIKSIFSSILEEILCIEGAPTSVSEQLEYLYRHYAKPSASPLYLLIHNIDGPMLRSNTAQHTLSHLCSLRNVRLVASIDHINAPLVLDSRRVSEYNVLWFDCTTLAAYTEETSYENSLLVQQNSNLALSSLMHVFKSLTPSSKSIFLLLADYQLDTQQDSTYVGMTFTELYQRCRERVLVNSELTLRAQLTEFKDHKLLKQKKAHDGAETLLIPLDAAPLAEFVEQQKQDD
uniref:Origin recognition complex subunit 2 n=1 Tax=Hirondellea gigas TaxID=1518452 RepID=A0A2P2IAJ6_9CRUS